MSTAWECMKSSAQETSLREPILKPILEKYITSHTSFGQALSAILSHKFCGDIEQEAWYKLMEGDSGKAYEPGSLSIADSCLEDLRAITLRDPACEGLVHAFLNFKGFKALASHRIAHVLWRDGRKEVALAVQARCAELFAVDIHPAAKIGTGLMIDHATGVVIGETATVGTNCSFLHGVTLGSSGKDKGFRHPQVGNDVLIGCNAIVLGYIEIGDNCKIGSGSIVLKPIPSNATAVGNPARIVGSSRGAAPAAAAMDVALHDVFTRDGHLFENSWCNCIFGSTAFTELDTKKSGLLDCEQAKEAVYMKLGVNIPAVIFNKCFGFIDPVHRGQINKEEFETLCTKLRRLSRVSSRGSLGFGYNDQSDAEDIFTKMLNSSEESIKSIWDSSSTEVEEVPPE